MKIIAITAAALTLAACSSSSPPAQQSSSEVTIRYADNCNFIPDPLPGEPRYVELYRIDENGQTVSDPLPGAPDGCRFDNGHWYGVGFNPFDVLIGQ